MTMGLGFKYSFGRNSPNDNSNKNVEIVHSNKLFNNSIFLELLGSGGKYFSTYYERLIINRNKDFLFARLGVKINSFESTPFSLRIPIVLSYQRKIGNYLYFDLGMGIGNQLKFVGNRSQNKIFLTENIGLKLLRPTNLFYKIGISYNHLLDNFNEIDFPELLPCLNIGYTF